MFAAVWIASAACSDARGTSGADRPQSPAVQAPGTAGLPDLAKASAPIDHEAAAAQIARASASEAALEPDVVDWSGGDPAHGSALYATHCAICHGGGGAGDGIATPALNPKPRDFRDGRFYLDGNANNQTGEDVDLARVILHGPAAFGGTSAMTGWRETLSDDDVRNLIAHIRTLAHPS